MPDTIKCNDLLNAAFDDPRILTADIVELQRYYLACTEMREVDILNERVKEGLPKRMEFIKHLIEMKQSELSRKSEVLRSKWTLGISIGTFLLLAIKTLHDISN